MKSAFKKIAYLLAVVIFVCILLNVAESYINRQIEEMYRDNKEILDNISGPDEKEKGNVWLENSAKGDSLLLVGSSELVSPVEQNPINYFPNNYYPHNISCIGHTCVQNYLNAVKFGSNSNNVFTKNNVVVIESLQWFMEDEINAEGFMANFSELQFYEFLHNPKISKKNKQYLCNRFLQIEESKEKTSIEQNTADIEKTGMGLPVIGGEKAASFLVGMSTSKKLVFDSSKVDYLQTHCLAKLYTSNNVFEKGIYYCTKPYYYLRYRFLRLKDSVNTYMYLKSVRGSKLSAIWTYSYIKDPKRGKRTLDWKKEYQKANAEGKVKIAGNDMCVDEEYYKEKLAPNLKNWKGIYGSIPLQTSNEWKDYEFFLSVCDELDIRPYIVVASTNGKYYDYLGLSKNKRDKYYDRVQTMAEKNGNTVLTLRNKEYEPYFYRDVMHLGWRGWLYVDQKISERYCTKS